MVLDDLKKIGYRVNEIVVRERSLLGEEVTRRSIVAENRIAMLRVSELGGGRYKLAVVVDSDFKEILENEGLDVDEITDDTVIGTASFRSLSEAVSKMRTLAFKLALKNGD